MKQIVTLTLGLLIVAALLGTPVASSAQDAQAIPADESAVEENIDSTRVEKPAEVNDKVIAYYFHGNRRCASCRKIEAYSAEAIETGFAEDLKSGALEWRVVNIDEEPNEHFIKDYQLYTKSVILSHVKDGKEIAWKNLEKVWTLLNDKDGFISYVQTETRAIMNGEPD